MKTKSVLLIEIFSYHRCMK